MKKEKTDLQSIYRDAAGATYQVHENSEYIEFEAKSGVGREYTQHFFKETSQLVITGELDGIMSIEKADALVDFYERISNAQLEEADMETEEAEDV